MLSKRSASIGWAKGPTEFIPSTAIACWQSPPAGGFLPPINLIFHPNANSIEVQIDLTNNQHSWQAELSWLHRKCHASGCTTFTIDDLLSAPELVRPTTNILRQEFQKLGLEDQPNIYGVAKLWYAALIILTEWWETAPSQVQLNFDCTEIDASYWSQLDTVNPLQNTKHLLQEGWNCYQQCNFEAAIQIWNSVLESYQSLPGLFALEKAIDKLGIAGIQQNNPEDIHAAIVQQKQSLQTAIDRGDRQGQEIALARLGRVYYGMGKFQEAIDYQKQRLELAQFLDNAYGQMMALKQLGRAYYAHGDYRQTIECYQQFGQLYAQEYQEKRLVLGNIGLAYYNLGDFDSAIAHLEQHFQLAVEIDDQEGMKEGFLHLGLVYQSQGNLVKAVNYFHQSLAVAQKLADVLGQGQAVGSLGNVCTELGTNIRGLKYQKKHLRIAQDLGYYWEKGAAFNNLGVTYLRMGRKSPALKQYRQALKIFESEKVGDRASQGIVLANIGFIYESQAEFSTAIEYYRKAIEIKEEIQSQIKTSELTAHFAEEQVDIYAHLVNLLWDSNDYEAAFYYAESAQARALINQLANGPQNFLNCADLEQLSQEQALRAEIAKLRTQLRTQKANSNSNGDRTKTISSELEKLEAEYCDLFVKFKREHPETASLISVDAAKLADIQALLDSHTTLIGYFVTPQRTLAFIVTRDRFDSVALEVSEELLKKRIDAIFYFEDLDNLHPKCLQELYQLLIAPLKCKIKTNCLAIALHGVLHYLPFAALTDGEKYLIDNYQISTLPSASVLRFLPQKRSATPNTLLALGNPPYQKGLPYLRYAKAEVEIIAQLYGTQALTGKAATETAFIEKAPQAGIIHIATHAEYNPKNPLCSTIYLAADEINDGHLKIYEIYRLDLISSTTLVVLSACQTQKGEVSKGDEIVALNRAFLYAGTPSVIASLWSVDDESTSILMGHFHNYLRSGETKASALQKAQIEARKKRPHPYYWSAFVLTGDGGKI
jgi:CHAT domain-containing protein/Tfp pilus assembly protein PilF